MSYGPFTTANYLSTASTPVTALPLTIACWCKSTSAAAVQDLVTIVNTSDGDLYYLLRLAGTTTGDPVRVACRAAGNTRTADSTTGYSVNTWHAAAGTFNSSTSRAAFIDGGSKGTSGTTAVAPTGLNAIALGYELNTSEAPANPLLGVLAEPAIWNVVLTDAEIASHAKGVSPLLIRPQSLVFYSPLVRDLIDYRAGLTITMTGTVAVADHPRIYGL